jgi:hypothetical protein
MPQALDDDRAFGAKHVLRVEDWEEMIDINIKDDVCGS